MSYRPNPSLNTYNKACHVYLDVDITNNSVGENQSPAPIQFVDTRSTAYLSNANEYFLSVVRWSIESNLPIAIPQIQLPQTSANTNLCVHSFTMAYHQVVGGVDSILYTTPQTFMVFSPENLYISYPVVYPTNPNDILGNEYFYLESVSSAMTMLNNTLQECFNDLVANIGVEPLSATPYLVYDEGGGFITYYGASDFINPTTTPPANGHYVQVFMNGSMYNWLNSFPAFNLGYTASAGKNYLLNFKLLPQNQNALAQQVLGTDGTTLYTFYSLTQEYPSVPAWSPISSIAFTSSLIPVEPTNVASPIIFGQSTTIVNTGGSALLPSSQSGNLASVLTDFEVPLTIGTEYRSILYYTPTSEYRLFDLISNSSLQKISINVFWKDKIGNYHQMYLRAGQSATIKMLMRKKEFNNIEPHHQVLM